MSYTPPGSPPPPPPGGYGYGPPGYPQGGYAAPVVIQNNGLATGALVTGLIALFCFPVLGLVSIPLGIMGLKKAGVLHGKGKGMAIAGIITGIVGILWGVAVLALVVFAADKVDDPDFLCGSDETSSQGYPCQNQGGDDPTPGDGGGVNSDPADQICNVDRFTQDPDC